MAVRARLAGKGAASSSHVVSLPGTRVTGDRVFVGFVNDHADASATPSTGWDTLGTETQSTTTNHRLSIFSRVLTGGAQDTLTVTIADATHGANREAAWIAVCMQGNGGTPETPVFNNGASASTGTVGAIGPLPSGAYDSLVFLGLDNNDGLGHTVTAPSGYTANLVTSGIATDLVTAASMDQTATATGFTPGNVTWTNADQWITGHVVVAVFSSTVNKNGGDTATGSEAGTTTASSTGGDSATGSEAGQLALIGGDTATGSETGYVSESKLGGDTATGSESGTTTGTATAGEATTGSESGSTSATLTPPATETATGSEGGHIAIPGEDTATGVDAHLPPTYVTVTFGDEATGSEGGHVETLFGNLIVNLYGIDPDDGALIPLPDYVTVSFSRQRNDRGAISVEYPPDGKNFDLLRTTVANNRDLEVELWTNGTPVGAMRGYLQEASGDDVAEGANWTFAGGFLEMRMDEVVVYPQDLGELITDPDTGEQEWSNARRELIVNADTPGELMTLIVEQAQDRGTLTDLELGFTTTTDSNGNPWAGLLTAKYSPGSSYTQILNAMVGLHLCEWAIEWNGTAQVLKVWNAEGRGADLTLGPRPVILRRGRNLLDAPRKWSVRDAGTTMLAAGQEGIYDDWEDATALARRGRRIERFATLGNAADDEAVLAFAQAELATNAPGTLTVEHSIGMLPGEPRPIIAFDIGDWVYSQVGTITERLRVVQWDVSLDSNRQLTGRVALNDTIQDAIERLRERLNAIQSGEAVIGTSEPGPTVEDRTPPAAPEGVVASSIAYQDEDAGLGQTLAMVTVGWNPVTTNADGADSPLVQAAVFILDKIEDDIANPPVPDPEEEDGGPDYDPFDPATWTWKNCPQIVQDFAAPLRAIWVEDGSPDTQTWLAAYIAEMTQVPTAAQDVAGYEVRYAYIGLGQVGGIPSSDPFPEEDRFYYLATPPDGTAGNSYSFGGVEGGSNIRIEVRAFDRTGNKGAWTSIGHDTSNDATPPPIPSAPTGLKTWFRTLDVPWDGLGAEGEPMPFDFFAVRVWVGQGADMTLPTTEPQYATPFNPLETGPQFVGTLSASGTWNVADLPIGVGWYACLQAVDYVGNASERSAVVGPVTAEQLVSQDLIDDIITANLLGPDSVQSVHIVNGAITTAKIVDAAIINAKIANLAVNDAKIDSLNAGKITTGTMSATLTISGSMWTSLDSNATRLGFSAAGLQLYRTNSPSAGSTLVGEWKTSDGSMLLTGTFRSGTSGQRIHIDTDGTISMFPTSGMNKSTITNESGEMVWRGPLTSSKSGRLNVNTLGVGMNYSQEGNLLGSITSEFVVLDKRARLQAPFIGIVVDQDYDTHDGSRHRLQFNATDSSGNIISKTGLSYGIDGSDWPGFFGNDTGLKWAATGGDGNDGRVICTGGTLSGSGILQSGGVDVPSSAVSKTEIEDARAIINPLETIRNARARKFRTSWRPNEAPQIGVIAEELPKALQRPMYGLDDDEAAIGIELSSQIGVLWGAIGQVLDQQVVATSGTAVFEGLLMPGETVEVQSTWDSKPPASPSGGFVQLPTALVGRATAWIKTGSVTSTGCVVVFKNTTKGPINAANGISRVAAFVIGLGLFNPPYAPPSRGVT